MINFSFNFPTSETVALEDSKNLKINESIRKTHKMMKEQRDLKKQKKQQELNNKP